MNWHRRKRAIELFLNVGIKPRKATPEDWQRANSILRKHNDIAMAAYKMRMGPPSFVHRYDLHSTKCTR